MPEKYKDEIEEILRKAGEVAPVPTAKDSERHPENRPKGTGGPLESSQSPNAEQRPSRPRPTITPGKVMLAGVILLLLGIRVSPLIWVGLALLVVAYLMYFVSPRSINYEKRWRGRSVEEDPGSPLDRFKRWIRK